MLRSSDIEAKMQEPAPGITRSRLFSDESETVTLEKWDGDVSLEVDCQEGCELLVLSGNLEEGGDQLTEGSWLRLPPGTTTTLAAGPGGCRFWRKDGHLLNIRYPDTRN